MEHAAISSRIVTYLHQIPIVAGMYVVCQFKGLQAGNMKATSVLYHIDNASSSNSKTPLLCNVF